MKAVLLAMAAAVSAAQLPPRAAPVPAEKGTGIIRGVVVDAQTGTALPGAVVQLSSIGTPQPPRGVQTNASGEFEFRDLAAAKYMLSAARAPYLFTRYGQKSSDSGGAPIELGPGQKIDKIIIAMSAGGVITGRVFDEFGYPAVGIQVQAMQYRFENGRRQLMPVYSSGSSGSTDDLGMFRIWGMTPGQYYVSAAPRPVEMNRALVTDSIGPVRTYFPGTPDAAGAQRVSVAAGQETGGVNIPLLSGHLARLRGRALTSTGEPFTSASLMLTRQEGSVTHSFGGGGIKADGSFEISSVAAGQYVLYARPMNARDDDGTEIARARLTVTGEDIDDILLVSSRGATLRGRFTTDEGVMLPAKPSQLQVRVEPAPEDRGPFLRPPPVKDDHSFELNGLFGRGRLLANLTNMPASPREGKTDHWLLKAVYWRGEDVTMRYLDFDATPRVDEIEVVFSRRWAEVTGTVIDARGQPLPDAGLVLFSADERRWDDPRVTRPLRTTHEGTYRITGLPAGEYLIADNGTMEPGQWRDPDFLRALVERATRLIVAEGEKKTLNLRVSTSP